jgi:hypothetical protein
MKDIFDEAREKLMEAGRKASKGKRVDVSSIMEETQMKVIDFEENYKYMKAFRKEFDGLQEYIDTMTTKGSMKKADKIDSTGKKYGVDNVTDMAYKKIKIYLKNGNVNKIAAMDIPPWLPPEEVEEFVRKHTMWKGRFTGKYSYTAGDLLPEHTENPRDASMVAEASEALY